ncbi:hypothetical protein [Litorivita sp. NS0012-18]|uniref:hypothetical protein n=1 Tax=Litorivita sp. NS0012-18 TaxID=3127655 RepID=UPI00333ECABE
MNMLRNSAATPSSYSKTSGCCGKSLISSINSRLNGSAGLYVPVQTGGIKLSAGFNFRRRVARAQSKHSKNDVSIH